MTPAAETGGDIHKVVLDDRSGAGGSVSLEDRLRPKKLAVLGPDSMNEAPLLVADVAELDVLPHSVDFGRRDGGVGSFVFRVRALPDRLTIGLVECEHHAFGATRRADEQIAVHQW